MLAHVDLRKTAFANFRANDELADSAITGSSASRGRSC
jgi:hypothetical protein